MGQVPTRYGLVGSGSLAKHLEFYFRLQNIPFTSWSRKQSNNSVEQVLRDVEVVLIAISDGAIENFIEENFSSGFHAARKQKLIHFSGALVTPLAQSFHPLMTFGDTLYDLKVYREMAFVTEPAPYSFSEIFPDLPNGHFKLSPEFRGLYHSLCVMSGNFTVLLWEKFFGTLENEFKIPREAAYPYLKQITSNLLTENKTSVLTGPLARHDQKTIAGNLAALDKDSYRGVYEAFVTAFNLEKKPGRNHEQHP